MLAQMPVQRGEHQRRIDREFVSKLRCHPDYPAQVSVALAAGAVEDHDTYFIFVDQPAPILVEA